MNTDNSKPLNLNLTLGRRLMFFLCITVLCYVLVAVLNSIVINLKGETTATLRILAVLQDLFMFMMPAIVTAMLATRLPARFLCIEYKPKWSIAGYALVTLLVAMPAMNALIQWNESISLPQSMAGVEEWMRTSEAEAQGRIAMLFGRHTVGSLIVSLFIVAILAGLSEELFFRGAFQRLLTTGGLNPHVAIWLVAFIFSAIHLQFYGFFGRLLLGAYFGYLLYWTGNLWIPILVHIFNNALYIVGNYQAEGQGGVDINATGSTVVVVISVILTALLLVAIYRRAQKR